MHVLALDIETDTSDLTEHEKAAGFTSRGLIPQISPVLSVAFTDGQFREVFHQDGNEATLLRRVAMFVGDSALGYPGTVLVTWNGSVFDLPFLADRARILGLEQYWYSGLRLTPDPSFVPKYDPLPGHAGGYTATWAGLRHVDMAYVDRDECVAAGVEWSLKPWAEHLGMNPVKVDRSRIHELSRAELDEYNASDAALTHTLATRHGARLLDGVAA